jgi:hypothetical protein
MRSYDAPGTATSSRETALTCASSHALGEHLREGLVRAYSVTLPLFLVAFFVVKRLAEDPASLFILTLLWVASTVAAGAWLALNDRRRAIQFERLRRGHRPASTMPPTVTAVRSHGQASTRQPPRHAGRVQPVHGHALG